MEMLTNYKICVHTVALGVLWLCCACVGPLLFFTEPELALLTGRKDVERCTPNQPRKVKIKNKSAQTSGKVHKRMKANANKYENDRKSLRKETVDVKTKLCKLTRKYHMKCDNYRQDKQSLTALTGQTHTSVLRLKRELIVLENVVMEMKTRLTGRKLQNKELIGRYQQIYKELVRATIPQARPCGLQHLENMENMDTKAEAVTFKAP